MDHSARRRWSLFGAILLTWIVSGCSSGSFEYRERPDHTEVAVLKDIQAVFPVVATQVKFEIDATTQIKDSVLKLAGKVGYYRDVVQLYEKLDQINADVRAFIVSNYLWYINSELDADPKSRQRGRDAWRAVNDSLRQAAFDIRKVKERIRSVYQGEQTLGDVRRGLNEAAAEVTRWSNKLGPKLDGPVATAVEKVYSTDRRDIKPATPLYAKTLVDGVEIADSLYLAEGYAPLTEMSRDDLTKYVDSYMRLKYHERELTEIEPVVVSERKGIGSAIAILEGVSTLFTNLLKNITPK